ncbi:MAG: triosephosphate isomerase, partial [Bdellovibrionales bacterium]|nr:triosephosphate isomerase [Bdellovibrionales bacterium]
GEVSPGQAREAGAVFALAGHSERRQFFGETDDSAVRRALGAHTRGMRAVFCLGERLDERDSGRTFQVLERQMAPLFAQAPAPPEGFSLAYEPVWAIGTGRTATTAQAEEAHAFLRKLMEAKWGSAAARGVRVLYGGSVKPENAAELMSCPNVDGVLVGGASLEAASFLAIAAGAVR